MLDDLDSQLLKQIELNGRATWAELAQTVGMSAPGVIDRIRRLEDRGIISGYAALVEPRSIGISLTSLVFLKLVPGAKRESFLELIDSIDEVVECHHVTGAQDYLLKVLCLDTYHLDRVLVDKLKQTGLIASSETMISLSCAKEQRGYAALASSALKERDSLSKRKSRLKK